MILSQLCLICFGYDCQEEALHKRITFETVQQLLLDNIFLSVSLEKTFSGHGDGDMILHKSFSQLTSKKTKSSTFQAQTFFLHGIQTCTSIIQQLLSQQQLTPTSTSNSIHPLLMAYLASIQLMGSIRTNSLFYHDVMQILKYITLIKFDNKEAKLTEKDLCFTKNRIQRTVKLLRQKIGQKERKLKKLNQNSHSFQSINQRNIFGDLTNQPLSQNTIIGKNKQQKQDYKKVTKIDDCMILKEILEESRFFEKLGNMFETIPNRCVRSESSQETQNFCMNILSYIELLQKTFIQAIQNKENDYTSNSQSLNYEIQKQNAQVLRQSINPQKTSYPFLSYPKHQPISTNQQLPEENQFAYIQGLPFPANRRSIDFSLLELTDDLLLSYIPALQKLKDLEEICIRKNRLTSFGYRMIKNLFPRLHSIDLRENTMTPEIVQIILDFKQLNILYLSQCKIQPASLVKICLNLEGINILYCDRLNFNGCQVIQSPDEQLKPESCDLRGIFYIMCLNLKKLMYFSVKGCFSPELTQYDAVVRTGCQNKLKGLSDNHQKEINILSKISGILKKRHGILQF